MSTLTYILGWPLAAAIALAFIPRNFRVVLRAGAILALLISALLALKVFLQFKTGASGYQFEQQFTWVKALGIGYHVGVDGINVLCSGRGAFSKIYLPTETEVLEEMRGRFDETAVLVLTGGVWRISGSGPRSRNVR